MGRMAIAALILATASLAYIPIHEAEHCAIYWLRGYEGTCTILLARPGGPRLPELQDTWLVTHYDAGGNVTERTHLELVRPNSNINALGMAESQGGAYWHPWDHAAMLILNVLLGAALLRVCVAYVRLKGKGD